MNRQPGKTHTRSTLGSVEHFMSAAGPAVDLSDNTNRWGMPPAAGCLLQPPLDVARYPEAYSASLRRALASYTGVSADMIVTGNGSDNVLDAATRACGEPGDILATIAPTFPMVTSFALLNGLRVRSVPLLPAPSFDLDLSALATMRPAIVYLCSPNNPTGTLLSRQRIVDLLNEVDGLVIVDEAYVEYSGVSLAGQLADHPNLLIVRTLSKAFGLAGLRIGYGLGQASLIAAIEKSRGPYTVNAVAERVAAETLTSGVAWMRERVTLAIEARAQLERAFRDRGLEPLPSCTNFTLVPVANAPRIADGMRARDVAVRTFTNLPRLTPALDASGGAAIRVTAGPPHEIRAALDAFDAARLACA